MSKVDEAVATFTCNICNLEKPLSEYWKDRSRPRGHQQPIPLSKEDDMRENKFRAWMPEKHQWYRGGAIQLGAALGNSFALSEANGKNIELQEYTGLKDKHGVEIYEGDIIKNLMTMSPVKEGVVEFDDCAFIVRDETGYWMPMRLFLPDVIEVIGNIYENPDLLTTKQGEGESDE